MDCIWHIFVNGESKGPFDSETIHSLKKHGNINEETFVWRQGMQNWAPMNMIVELQTNGGAERKANILVSILSVAALIILMIGLVILIIGRTKYDPVDFSLYRDCIAIFMLVFTAQTLVLFMLARARSIGTKDVVKLILSFAISMLFIIPGVMVFSNGYLDSGPIIVRTVPIIGKGKATFRNTGIIHSCIEVQSWSNNNRTEIFTIDDHFLKHINPDFA